ncbi:proton-conducting transporter transmembrane domain-containing protein [Haloplanus aerogenes]|uniref:Oxidoreductase n=1 Tax=Haloplanus aerogenes TaxID=660522 RepID=A0A3M0DPJ3_9EURY|nr:proton-conducting transporter membrane subunit [Haloplanus aerogenes]AZH24601.1 oxidoreductase [Haloplanus aerogenes]RMB23741.1 NAD(P)H-quinone oxidoreductase subunit 5 [Haloplanus aerogenes]
MTGSDQQTTVGSLPETTTSTPLAPAVFTRLVWLLWVASLGALVARLRFDGAWELPGVAAVDGLTVVMWVVVTFFSGIVHSYSRRYMAGSRHETRFFTLVFAFTLVVMALVAADHLALFAAAWLAMGLLMADLIGLIRGWPQARAAASVARRYFLASSGLLAVALLTLWLATGATTVSGVVAGVDAVPQSYWLVAAGALLLAAMIQSALVPFHTWLLSSMTAPTPASALMHAGFVNAGGVLLVRFAPVAVRDPTFMLLIVVVGAVSALLGKLLKSVQTDVKGQLGCSTVGQMGFMIAQAGLGFFGAAITHLILHGFYKAYQFLASGSRVERTTPTTAGGSNGDTSTDLLVALPTAVAGGAVFALLTGKGTALDSGLLLALFVVLTTFRATREMLQHTSLPATVRYGAVPLVFLPAIAGYAAAYHLVTAALVGLPVVTAPAALTPVHGAVAAGFVLAYVAIESGVYRSSTRLYVMLSNAASPPTDTVLTSTEEYNEY